VLARPGGSGRVTTVAVLGTGIMGAPMARHLVKAGLEVRVWNRTIEKAQPLADDGATVCDSPAQALQGADFLLTVLADVDAVEASVTADDALAKAGSNGSLVWVQASTVGIAGTARLMQLAADAGVRYVDAPVLGTRTPAEKGALTVLASAPDELRDMCRPLFEAYGAKTIWVGDGDRATRLKLVVNSWVLALTTAVGEAMALADGLGLDPKRFLDTIEGGPLDVDYAHVKGDMMIQREFPPSFPSWGAAKDAGLIAEAAGVVGVRMPVADGARSAMQRAVDLGHSDDDMAAVWFALAREE
jgi:3-hydroxyisobutyrate dehydrogenase